MHFCYEAGPCGYGLYRQLVELGHDCVVVDLFQKINGIEVNSHRKLQLVTAALPHNAEITVEVLRKGKVKTISFTPELQKREHPETGEVTLVPTMGVTLAQTEGISSPLEPISIGRAAEWAVYRVWRIISDTMVFIHAMVFKGADTSQLSGPIGIAKHSANAADRGLPEFIMFVAFVSTAIGLFNLFPIPILDGGHLCFYLYEWVRGKPTNDTIVKYSTMAGLSLLLLLMVFVTFNNDLGLGEWFSQD